MNGVLDSIYSEAGMAIEGFPVTLSSTVIAGDQCLSNATRVVHLLLRKESNVMSEEIKLRLCISIDDF